MAASLKQQLASRPDVREREITLTTLGGEPMKVTIRRLTIAERDKVVKEFKAMGTDANGSGIDASIAIVQIGVVSPDEPLTKEDVLAMPAVVIDEIGKAIMDFNGWSEAGRAQLADQFRPTAGSAV